MPVTIAMFALLAVNFLSDAGIFYDQVTALSPARLPWGEVVTIPVATENELAWLMSAAWLVALPYIGFAIYRQFHAGEVRRGATLSVVAACIVAPAYYETFLHGPEPLVFPFLELALWGLVLVASLMLTDAVVQLAATRRSLEATRRFAEELVDTAPDAIARFVTPSRMRG